MSTYDADAIVVGHTLVDKVTPLYGKKVYAVDVNTNEAAQEALVFENGVATVVAIESGRMLPPESEPRTVRKLSVFNPSDRDILQQMLERSYALSQLPQPY